MLEGKSDVTVIVLEKTTNPVSYDAIDESK
jgi:hypothetical protein